ncbi:MAG: PLP-dependent aminotransferase family protein [Meiothermus sp.]|uniref:aminotransferase-like domain-containing protein n=1 Tax=Meiothermus sp. TaxID=1955249 RepID=UPI0025DE86D6|nr:PLP-dependent aminotransferase family protein [Meiothermus sp.]MCS7067304.1 PLP-dependent aminotransferase family protein [Meiothermus sp.]MDW8425514.1 PLP-dependent aminotransferase family protein [Meiothermus sp.]
MNNLESYYQSRFAARTQRIQASTIREILKLTTQPGFISFAGGLPAADLFPIERIAEATQKVLSEHADKALQYSTTEGYLPLREWIASRMPGTSAENVQIVSGSQQGLDLMGKVFIDPGSKILVEAPTYLGALSAFNPYEPQYISVSMDEEGLRLDELEAALKTHRFRFMYVLPTFQNPSGRLMGLERRKAIVELARHYQTPILEDDAYAELYFSGEPLPTLYALDQALGGGNVVYLSTTSKTLAPGLRVAWVVGPRPVIQKIVYAKQGADLHSPTLNQMLVYELVREGDWYRAQIEQIRQTYQTRRTWMLEALQKYMPEDIGWIVPQGGMFFWLTAPQGLDSLELLKQAVEEKMAFVPGQPFYADGSGQNTLRLSYSSATHEQIEEGIKRLGRAVHKRLGREPVV